MTLLSLTQDGEQPKGGRLIQGKDGSGNAQDVLVDTDGTLQVDIVSGSSSGTEYTEGDTDTTFSGPVVQAEGPSNTATPLQVDSSKHLQVDIAADSVGIGGGTQYTEADTDSTITGNVMMMEDSDTIVAAQGTAADGLLVNLGSNNDVSLNAGSNVIGISRIQDSGGDEINISAFPASDGAAIQNNLTTASFPLVYNGSTWDRLRGDSTNGLLVNLGSNNDITGTVTANLSATDNAVLDTIASPVATISSTPLQRIAIFDDSDTQITSFGGGTQYNEDAAHTTGDTGTMALAVRNDSLGSLVDTDGDYAPLQVSSSGALYVRVDSSALPSGASTASNQSTIIGHVDGIEGLLTTIDADTGTIAGAVSGTEMQVDIVSGTVDLGATDNAVLDSIATNTSNSATSLGVMDDWDNAASDGVSVSGDVAHDAADAGEPVKIGGKAQTHLSDPDEVADNDRVNGLFDRVGRMAVYQGYPIKSAVINASTSGNNTIVAAVTTKRIRVLSVLIVSDGTVDVRWESGAGGTALTGQVPLQAREGYSISNPWGLFETTAVNTLLNLELSAAVNVHGFISYIEVDD